MALSTEIASSLTIWIWTPAKEDLHPVFLSLMQMPLAWIYYTIQKSWFHALESSAAVVLMVIENGSMKNIFVYN